MSRTIVLLCVSVIACGGSEGAPKETSSVAGAAIDPCTTSQALTLHMLADFESGSPPGLSVTSDNSKGSTIEPDSSHTDPYPSAIDVRCGVSHSALHVKATKLADWGANIELDFKDTTNGFDASSYDGFSFWVRRGEGNSGRSMLALVLDPYTATPFNTAMMPFCGDSMGEQNKCDPFGHAVGFDEQWSLFAIPFSAMRQKGYGKASPALDKEEILGFKFSLGVGDWDLWLDDIAFYKKAP
jgi:hypothetical protein